jgi:hypothetical protein
MNQFRPAKRRVKVSVGESVRILRELQELSQNQLSECTGDGTVHTARRASGQGVGA